MARRMDLPNTAWFVVASELLPHFDNLKASLPEGVKVVATQTEMRHPDGYTYAKVWVTGAPCEGECSPTFTKYDGYEPVLSAWNPTSDGSEPRT